MLVAADRKLLRSGEELDKAAGGALTRAMNANDFQGKKDQLLDLLVPAGLDNSRLLLVGIGDPKKLKSRDMQALGSAIVGRMEDLASVPQRIPSAVSDFVSGLRAAIDDVDKH